MLPDVRRVHPREVGKLRGGGSHLPIARPYDPIRLHIPDRRKGDPQVDPRDPTVLPIDGVNKEHHRLAEHGERRQRNRFENPQEEAGDSFLHDRGPLSNRTSIIREISSHPSRYSTSTRSAPTENGTSSGRRTRSFSVVIAGRPPASRAIRSR